jgi:hypothetical protein
MSEGMLLPKFLTKEIAEHAVSTVINAVFSENFGLAKRHACHIVVIVPSMKDDRAADYPDYPNYVISPAVLYEESINRTLWTGEYDNIARCKGLQLWHDRNDDRTDVVPHLLFPGDTPFWGGVKRRGIVVACSGIQSWFDKMIAGMVADMIVAMAYNAWMTSKDREDKIAFLT